MTILKSSGSAALQPLDVRGSVTGKTQLASMKSEAKRVLFENTASGTLPPRIQSEFSTYSKFLALQNNATRTTTATPLQPKNQTNPLFDLDGWQPQRGIQLEPKGRSSAAASLPVLLASTQSVDAKQARVVVEGVSVPRFQPQEAMSKRYSEADLTKIGISPANTRIYVIDDFVNATTFMGMGRGSNAVYATHGDVVTGIASATLKGKGEVTRLNIGEKGKADWDNQALIRHIHQVIATEAKRQNKTIATVDLSQVTISMSLKFSRLAPIKEIAAAISAFTARGGHFFAAAGNNDYTAGGAVFPNTNIVDGSNQRVGQDISKVQNPWSEYKNEAVDANGNDVRSKRLLDPTSQSIIAPSKLETRIVDGAIEFRDDSNPRGWSKLVDASHTTTVAVPALKADGLAGLKPQKMTSAKLLKDFQQWQFNTYGEAIKNAKNKNAETSMDLTPAELSAVDIKVAAERKRVLGDQPVMTLDEYLKFTGSSPDSALHQQTVASVPKGLTPEQVIVSAALVMDSESRSSLQYYVLDKKVGLRTTQPDNSTALSNGTSWATPAAAASHAIWQQEQVAAAKAAAGKQ